MPKLRNAPQKTSKAGVGKSKSSSKSKPKPTATTNSKFVPRKKLKRGQIEKLYSKYWNDLENLSFHLAAKYYTRLRRIDPTDVLGMLCHYFLEACRQCHEWRCNDEQLPSWLLQHAKSKVASRLKNELEKYNKHPQDPNYAIDYYSRASSTFDLNDLMDGLSDDAQRVVNMALFPIPKAEREIEKRGGHGKAYRGVLREYLEHKAGAKWKKSYTSAMFSEIQNALGE